MLRTLAFMSHQEMNPKIWKEMVAEKDKTR